MASPAGYSRTQIILHWLVAIMIAAQFVFHDAISAAWHAFVSSAAVPFNPLVAAHVFGGIAIGAFMLWRFVLRFRRGVPALPQEETPALKWLAHAVHWAFYAVVLLLVVSGGAAWFGGVGAAASAHGVLKTLLLALVGLHVGGAFVHWLVLKTDVLMRMFKPAT
ncbi:MAG: cytochrome B [Hyphomicrobiales bacterium]|nr:MAG: cytochrome B [Hyphomicrobiales bacterium]